MFTVGPPGATDRGIRSWIKTDGTLWSCGYNVRGDLGQNSTSPGYYSSPVQIPGSWSSGNIGGYSYCCSHGIKTDGSLWGWGQNEDGCLGTNQAHELKVSSPAQVGTDTTWGAIRGGSGYVLTFKTNGQLFAWGQNEKGQLGLNNKTARSSPCEIGGDTDWTSNITLTHAGTSLAVRTNGTLWSWGYNGSGVLGTNQAFSPSKRAWSSPVQIGTDTTWGDAKLGEAFVNFGVVKSDGTLWTWGRGSHGQNMQNNSISLSSPTQVPGTNWAYYSGSYYHALAGKTDGTLWAVGKNEAGAFGIPSIANDASFSSPVQVAGNGWAGTTPEKLTTDLGTQFCFRTPNT